MKKLALIIIGVLLSVPQVFAQNLGTFTIYPSYQHEGNSQWIIREINSGKQYEDSITVENLTDEKITLALEVFNGLGDEKNFKIDENNRADSISKWTSLEENNVTLAAHEKRKIKIKFIIPTGIKEQKYSGAILASLSKSEENNVKIVSRIGTRVYLTINNHREIQNNVLNNDFNNISLAISALALLGIIYTLKPSKKVTQKI